MRPETAQFFENARDMLVRGRRMLEVDLYEDAGRAAHLAYLIHGMAAIRWRVWRNVLVIWRLSVKMTIAIENNRHPL